MNSQTPTPPEKLSRTENNSETSASSVKTILSSNHVCSVHPNRNPIVMKTCLIDIPYPQPIPTADQPMRVAMVRGLPIAACRQSDLRPLIASAIVGDIPPLSIATINLNFLRQADSDPSVHTTLLSCSLRVADGWPVMTFARLAGTPLPERVTGASLVPTVLTWARQAGWRVALVGGLPETREALMQAGIWKDVICGHWLPTYRAGEPLDDPDLCRELRATAADIVLVALGCPKQERWLLANLANSGARAGIGIGGSLEFLAGVRSRAPRWVQESRLEFAYRFLQEPRRLGGRYLGDAIYWLRLRLSGVDDPRKLG